MSLIRQVWVLVLGMIVLACAASVAVSVWTARDYLQTQLTLKNNDNAQALALSLSQQQADAALVELVVSAQFDTGFYRRITLRSPEGRVLVERRGAALQSKVPDWFVTLAPIHPTTGVAQISKGWSPLGTLEVESQVAYAYESLWSTTLRIAGVLGVLGLVAGMIGRVAVQQIRRPLDAMTDQAMALTERRFVAIGEPAVPELRRVAQALNAMVTRVRVMFGEQVEQIEHLRQIAHCDARTGVADRRHFMSRLHDELGHEDGSGRGLLVLVRFQHLGLANQRLGHAVTDEMLRTAASGLEQAVDGHLPLLAGRLNGADFAVLFDDGAEADAAVRAVLARAQLAFSPFDGAVIVSAAAQWQRGDTAAAVLQAVDAALARAELRGHGSHEVVVSEARMVPEGGEEGWRRQLEEALNQSRLVLGGYPLVNAAGHLLHRECPVRVGLGDGGELAPASVWLPWAVRTGQVGDIDRIAAGMALEAIEADGVPRGINVALNSLKYPSFVQAMRSLMEEHAEAATRLSIDIDESALATGMPTLVELCHQLRPLGVRVGIEHAGERTAQAPALLAVGLDFIKLRGSFVAGVATDAAQAALVRGTLAVFHGLGLMVYAEGVQSAQDLQALWMLGVDGVTGPVIEAIPTV